MRKCSNILIIKIKNSIFILYFHYKFSKRESKLAQLISDKENDITEMVSIKY